MKAILLICLIASLNCNLVDTALCLIKNDEVKNVVSEILAAIKEKNFNKIIEIALSKFSDFKLIVQNCLTEEPNLQSKTGTVPLPKKICNPLIKYNSCLAFCRNSPYINKANCLRNCKYGC